AAEAVAARQIEIALRADFELRLAYVLHAIDEAPAQTHVRPRNAVANGRDPLVLGESARDRAADRPGVLGEGVAGQVLFLVAVDVGSGPIQPKASRSEVHGPIHLDVDAARANCADVVLHLRRIRDLAIERVAREEVAVEVVQLQVDRKSTRLNSSHVKISYAVFCLKKKQT